MKPIIFPLIFLLLAGCATPDEIAARSVGHVISLGTGIIDFDTNGYYNKRNQPHQNYCTVKTSKNVITYVPCK